MNETLSAVNKTLGAINETLGTMSKTLVRIEKRLDSMDKNIEVLTHNSHDMGNTLRSVNGNLHSLNRNVQDYTLGVARALDDEFARGLDKQEIFGFRIKKVMVREKTSIGNAENEWDIVAFNENALFLGEIKRQLRPQAVQAFKHKLALFDSACRKHPELANKWIHAAAPEIAFKCGRIRIFGMVGGEQIMRNAANMAGKSNLTVLRLKNREVIISPPPGDGRERSRPAASGKG